LDKSKNLSPLQKAWEHLLYWNLHTSDISDPQQAAGNIPDDRGITGLTDVQLRSGLPVGFDPAIWA
jgi:hypothetical protein